MLTIRKLSKAIGARPLFEEVDITVNYGERVAIVGPNGAGKTTLFRLILGEDTPDRGVVERDQWTTAGYLPQEGDLVQEETALGIALGRAGELEALEAILQEHESEGTTDSPAYFEAQAKHDALTDPALEAKAKAMLRGLGFRERDWRRPAAELSGGWVMRAHLARLLAMEPDLLLLDEPTNHLDLHSLWWLQHHLKSYPGAILMVSHDRDFMDAIVESVHEIKDRKMEHYRGNYSQFLVEARLRFEQRHTAWKNQQKEIAEVQGFIDRFRSTTSKAAQVQSRIKQLEKVNLLPKPSPPRKVFKIQFPQPERSGQRTMSLEDVCFSYDGRTSVYSGLDLEIQRGDRTVLVGPNGAGKSTLLKIMAGVVDIQSGKRRLGHNCKIGYFSQHRSETLNAEKTVLEEVLAANPKMKEDEARGVLGSFLFRKEEVFKKTAVLSGGEKSRLHLVKFLVDPPNLLLMDEPTTHLDIISVEALIVALREYEGTLVFISHDAHFIRQLATQVYHVSKGSVTTYSGGYDYYLEKTNAEANARAAIIQGLPIRNEPLAVS